MKVSARNKLGRDKVTVHRFMVKGKGSIKDLKSSLKMLIFANNCRFGSSIVSSLECHCERSEAISCCYELTWHNPRDCQGLRPRNDKSLCIIASLPRHLVLFQA